MTKKRADGRKERLKPIRFVFLMLAGIVNAIGVTMFLAPVRLYDSGISGTSMLLSQLTNLPLPVFLLLLNVPLFLIGLKRQGRNFTVYSVFAVIVYSAAAWIITDVLPVDVSTISPLAGSDLLLCAIFGGLISGLGSGLTIRFGGAMDGIEVMAVIFAGTIGISVGTFVMAYNVVLYVICGIMLRSWTLPLYSIVAYAVALKTVDYMVEGIDRSKAANIVTNRPEQVAAAISEAFGCGITMMPAQGFYSRANKTVVYVVLNRFQIPRMKDLVHEIDPTAYISITEIADVFVSNSKKL